MLDLPNIILPGASALLGSGVSFAVARWALGRAVKIWDGAAKDSKEALSLAKTHAHPEFVRIDVCRPTREGCAKERAALWKGVSDKLRTVADLQEDLRKGQEAINNRLSTIEANVAHIKENGSGK